MLFILRNDWGKCDWEKMQIADTSHIVSDRSVVQEAFIEFEKNYIFPDIGIVGRELIVSQNTVIILEEFECELIFIPLRSNNDKKLFIVRTIESDEIDCIDKEASDIEYTNDIPPLIETIDELVIDESKCQDKDFFCIKGLWGNVFLSVDAKEKLEKVDGFRCYGVDEFMI